MKKVLKNLDYNIEGCKSVLAGGEAHKRESDQTRSAAGYCTKNLILQ